MKGEVRAAEVIAARSGSNLAMALRVLPPECREDMRVFYAFCRVVDDLADEPGLEMEERVVQLQQWREALMRRDPMVAEPPLAAAVRRVFQKHGVAGEFACEIVRGCEMDLGSVRYRSWEELRRYCYRVASVVGLISAKIFGGQRCERYAERLGLALQMTNILRDAVEDFERGGRVYLPTEELEYCGVAEGAWVRGEPAGWRELMEIQAGRTEALYVEAEAALPDSERRKMVAAEIMRGVYQRIFQQMRRDGFKVWRRRYRLGRLTKAWVVASVLWRNTGFVS